MAIPERQLETWANFHSTEKAKYTHEVIRRAIRSYSFSRDYKFDDYLQGSYKNKTNIYADTDVDIVIQLNSIFVADISRLNEEQQAFFEICYPEASYGLEDFKKEVLQALYNKFGYERVEIGNKAIKILKDNYGKTCDADVVVALQYRLYVPSNYENAKQDEIGLYYYEGIWFKTLLEEIVNFPKLHYENGKNKNQKTEQKFKRLVRIFKNMRNKAIEDWYIVNKKIAPSYFIECLLYNVPDSIYIACSSYQELLENVMYYLETALDNEEAYSRFTSQNEIVPLFGTSSDKWNVEIARAFIKALRLMWDSWR
jgi:hypothetical protein